MAKHFDAPMSSTLTRDERIKVIREVFPDKRTDEMTEDVIAAHYDHALLAIERRTHDAERSALADVQRVVAAPGGVSDRLDRANEKAAKEAEDLAKAGPPACASALRKA